MINRRSWIKSTLAAITLAISDGIPKILADLPSQSKDKPFVLTEFICPNVKRPYPSPTITFVGSTDYENLVQQLVKTSNEIYKVQSNTECYALVSRDSNE